ncbi:hypothetical protein [Flavobacterium sp. UMI-01]|uniref:hypothetical protein n=1 Tax=Flavobacterium sp. UMI-01 TaxID=1441053 RepID=UPI001C7DC827|nr:hypothetical protein [Flavobacterium sp. UMI-01]GIZ07925.1 hypothetical protein FUMI01_06520 [Flavobacterium sp. UMI-01]
MKKLILSAAILLGSMTAFAAPYATPTPIHQSVNIQDEYTEISMDQLPDAVKATIKNSFPAATLNKAYINEKKEYKLEITMSDQSYTVYTDAEGNVVKK